MDKFLRVKSWDEHQQYKDGRPIHWIKLQLALLDDYDFLMMPEETQMHLVKIWLLAGRTNNKVPDDPDFIRYKIGAKSPIDFNTLIDKGFLIPYETVRDCTETENDPYLEKRRGEESREEKEKPEPAVPACPHSEIIDIYHEVLPERPAVLKQRWTGSQSERELRSRWREAGEHQTLDFWRSYFASVRANDWRMGRGKWKGVDLHWLVKRSNFDKVVQDWANAA